MMKIVYSLLILSVFLLLVYTLKKDVYSINFKLLIPKLHVVHVFMEKDRSDGIVSHEI